MEKEVSFNTLPEAVREILERVQILNQKIDSLMKSSSSGEDEEISLANCLDNQDVMQKLHISSRTLQTLRTNGTLPFSRIGKKLYYRKNDIQKILSNNFIMYKYRNQG